MEVSGQVGTGYNSDAGIFHGGISGPAIPGRALSPERRNDKGWGVLKSH